jgi:hypothetical protein
MRYRPHPRIARLASFLAPLLGSFLTLPAPARADQTVTFHGKRVSAAEAAQYRAKAASASTSTNASAAPAYGIASTSLLTLGPCDASVRDVSRLFSTGPGCNRLQALMPGPSVAYIGFPIHLPTGALITEITLNYYDNHTTKEPSLGLWQADATGFDNIVAALTPDPFSGGNNSQTFVVEPPYVVDNSKTLAVLGILDNLDDIEHTEVNSLFVRYRLQVSPAPATATFTDVPPDHPFFRYVEALAAAGITAGCGEGVYCVDDPVTRGQIAVFLSVALGLHFPN